MIKLFMKIELYIKALKKLIVSLFLKFFIYRKIVNTINYLQIQNINCDLMYKKVSGSFILM